ncbi:MAG: adenylosuccinate synthetase [Clostridiales bacterium]|nr:adenylosuccinate synthetase [Clostridiales bacterium]
MLTAVVGINWGDEGKGRMVDLLSGGYDVICRYQGGNNAGHTVINEKGRFILNLLPSGILRDDTVNVMGGGMVIDLEHLADEIKVLVGKGINVTPENLKISDKAFICLPHHKKQDVLEEDRLGDKKYGSTRRGIAPAYGDKYMKKGIRMGDLINTVSLEDKLYDIIEWKNLMLKGYGFEVNYADTLHWLMEYGLGIAPYITDTTEYLQWAVSKGKSVLFEAQLGALRDIDYGIYPYTTSSTGQCCSLEVKSAFSKHS